MIPAMVAEAEGLKKTVLEHMPDQELAAEISRRVGICEKWKKEYWDYCIPFAHAIRLFGMVYNRAVKPEDPYEFLELLAGSKLESVRRNERLQKLADRIGRNKRLGELIRSGKPPGRSELSVELTALAEELRIPLLGTASPSELQVKILKFITEMAKPGHIRKQHKGGSKASLKRRFLSNMPKSNHNFALKLLDLARASYRLRDDDNIYLGRIEKRLLDALQEAGRRSSTVRDMPLDISLAQEVAKCIRDPNYHTGSLRSETVNIRGSRSPISFRANTCSCYVI